MKAVVLVGGEGTRLRPLTETIKKELLPLVDRAALHHTLDHLVRHGVREVLLSSSYLEQTFQPFIESREGDPAITWIAEAAPLGTGGAIVNVLPALDNDEPFFALNGDILTDLDLTRMLSEHRRGGAAATIAITHVEDARPFGLVATGPDGRVLEFREKPAELVPGDVNAGTYVLTPGSLAGWDQGRPISIEREIFPALIAEGRPVLGFASDAYWMDLGTPEKYLQAHFDILEGLVGFEPAYPSPFVAAGGTIEDGARAGRRLVVGPGAIVKAGATAEDSVLLEGAVIEAGAVVRRSILGPRSRVGAGARVDDSVLAEGAVAPAGAELSGARVSAGETASSAGMP